MLVSYIVQTVRPGALTSLPAGEWIVDHRDSPEAARQLAECFNAHNGVDGVSYRVELFDDATEAPIPARY